MNPNSTVPEITSLPTEITKLIADAGHASPEAWTQALNPEALTTDNVDHQRFLINRTWRQILLNAPKEVVAKTREARSCLLDTPCEPKHYLRFFKEVIIPCASEQGLLA
jgi:hypothetical protein